MKKPDTKREMTKPVVLGFKVADRQYRFHQIVGWKSRTEFRVEYDTDAGRYVCDCVKFRLASKCEHVDMIEAEIRDLVRGPADWVETHDMHGWAGAEPMEMVAVLDQEANRMGVLEDTLPDLTLADVCWLLSEDTSTDSIRDAGGVLNPSRLYAEAQTAEAGNLLVSHRDVVAAGKAVEPLDSPDPGVDEDMVAPDFKPGDLAPTKPDDPKPEKPKPKKKKAIRKPVPAWKKVPKPDPNVFWVDDKVWMKFQYCIANGKNIILTGPAGSGKSELTYIATKAAERAMEAFNMGATTEPRTALIGKTELTEKGTHFEPARFALAVQKPEMVVLLDELTRAGPDAYNILLPLMDRQGFLPLDESEGGGVVKKADGVSFVATANLGMTYVGCEPLDTAEKQRFAMIIDMDYPPKEAETGVLLGRCKGLKKSHAERLVNIADTQRRLARVERSFKEEISTRMLIEAGEAVAAGMDFKDACEGAFVDYFSSEGGDNSERTQIRQIIQKGG